MFPRGHNWPSVGTTGALEKNSAFRARSMSAGAGTLVEIATSKGIRYCHKIAGIILTPLTEGSPAVEGEECDR